MWAMCLHEETTTTVQQATQEKDWTELWQTVLGDFFFP
jgi:hypothetical protein